jgi:hypothetical protein|tara:strand:+ start:165 stop:452 length:288 start_codon:yes stop_codon:yes gene_type:complete
MPKRRRNRNNRNQPAYVCIGVVVKDPNGRNPLNKRSIGDLFADLASTLPQKPQYRFEELMDMKKSELVAIARSNNIKIWLCWNKTKISNAIIGEQ